jgi:hypothetical protein
MENREDGRKVSETVLLREEASYSDEVMLSVMEVYPEPDAITTFQENTIVKLFRLGY